MNAVSKPQQLKCMTIYDNLWLMSRKTYSLTTDFAMRNSVSSNRKNPDNRNVISDYTYFLFCMYMRYGSVDVCQFNKDAHIHDRSWWTSSAKLGSSPHQKIQSSRRPGVWCLRHTLSTSAFRQRLKLHRMGSSSVTGKRMGDEVGPCHTKHFHLIPVRSAWRQRERENVLEKSIMWDGLAATSDKATTPLGLIGMHMQKRRQTGNLSVWLCTFDKCGHVRRVSLWLMQDDAI